MAKTAPKPVAKTVEFAKGAKVTFDNSKAGDNKRTGTIVGWADGAKGRFYHIAPDGEKAGVIAKARPARVW